MQHNNNQQAKDKRQRCRGYYNRAKTSTPVFLLYGLPGCGKSRFAQVLAACFPRTVIISTDSIRFELRVRAEDRSFENKTYTEMVSKAVQYIRKGNPVVLDATFYRSAYRNLIYRSIERLNVKLFIFEFITSRKVCQKRVARRQHIGISAYQGVQDKSVVDYIAANADHLTRDEKANASAHYIIDTTTDILEIKRGYNRRPVEIHEIVENINKAYYNKFVRR